MRVWRLCRARHAAMALAGDGGLRADGRWHRRGTRIVYTSATLSLAALEMLVNLDQGMEPPDLVAIEVEIPDALEIERIAASRLKAGWDAPTPITLTRQLGTAWVASMRSPVLGIPSAVIPRESNYVLNPAHPHFRRIRVAGRAPFSFDSRLLS